MQAVQLLAPQIPLLFMGEEWGATQPFCFFTDFHDELADAVREGRRREFKKFPAFASEEARAHIPDPNAETTFQASRLDRSKLDDPDHRAWLDHVSGLLALRREQIVPRLAGIRGHAGEGSAENRVLDVKWRLGDGSRLSLIANLNSQDVPAPGVRPPGGVLFAQPAALALGTLDRLPPWSVLWTLQSPA